MTDYKVRDRDGGDDEIISANSTEEAAQEFVDIAGYAKEDETYWVAVYVQELDDDGDDVGSEERIKIAIDPDEPDCAFDRDEHEWIGPISLVGGIEENPGVYGHGGGVTITTVCRYCGTERVEDTWAQDRSDGEQGLRSVSYDEGKYAGDVEPEYRYEVESALSNGEALITVDAYQFGEKIAGACFVVGADGDLEQDVQSDGCESNPFDDDGGWPPPPQDLIDEAQELAQASEEE